MNESWTREVERRLTAVELEQAITRVSKEHMDKGFAELKEELKQMKDSITSGRNWLLGLALTPLFSAIVFWIVNGGLVVIGNK